MDIANIRRNSYGFSFLDTLVSFINNHEFSEGTQSTDEQKRYIWNALSAIGEDYAETVYENIINYIDNAANVDLCKVKSLQSMFKILGIKYTFFEQLDDIPVEVMNLIDILSINKSYLVRSGVFNDAFYQDLSAAGCIENSTADVSLSDEISGDYLSCYEENRAVLNDTLYSKFLYNVYDKILKKYVYMKYADAENGMDSAVQYIYENIKSDLVTNRYTYDTYQKSTHQKEIDTLILRYGLKNFDVEKIVDNIENAYDSLDNYSSYEQQVISCEVDYRNASYSSSSSRNYTPSEMPVGYNVTRYSYYRERKVREYFSFIENAYQSLIMEDSAIDSLKSDSDSGIEVYDKDSNYFTISGDSSIHLLITDETNNYTINSKYIGAIAQLLADQTIEISELRDQVKTQMQKNYIKGTFLLVSYIVNEYLKYNIANKKCGQLESEDGIALSTVINKASQDSDNISLIEYYDDTEYYNISTKNDDMLSNTLDVNSKFWDSEDSVIGVNSNDIPLDEIENFYRESLNVKKYGADDIVQFLSIIFEYGANSNYIDKDSEEFVCQLHDGREIGNPDTEIAKIQQDILSVNLISANIGKYVESGFQICSEYTVEQQIEDLVDYMSAYYIQEISSHNDDTRDLIYQNNSDALDTVELMNETFTEISASYEDLKATEKYKYFMDQYTELEPAFLKPKLVNFKTSCDNGIVWYISEYFSAADQILRSYLSLSSDLYNKLFTLSVWPEHYWQYYGPNYEDELTAVTRTLNSYLTSQIEVIEQDAKQHLQNHYDALLGYKENLLTVLATVDAAAARLQAYKDAVQVGTKTDLEDCLTQTVKYWSEYIDKMKLVKSESKYEVTYDYVVDVAKAYCLTDEITYEAPAIYSSDTIEDQLYGLKLRCYYPTFERWEERTNCLVVNENVDPAIYPCTKQDKGGQAWHKEPVDWDEDGKVTEWEKIWDDVYYKPIYEKSTVNAHNLDDIQYPWSEYYSSDLQCEILAAYDNAIAELTSTVELINNELTCSNITEIDNPRSTRESVQEDTTDVLESLVQKIGIYASWISRENEWKNHATSDQDVQLMYCLNRLNRIHNITLPQAVAYNIRWIDWKFSRINLSIDDLLESDPLYFENFVRNEADRVDTQLCDICKYMYDRNAECSSEVVSEFNDISARYDKNFDEIWSYSHDLQRYEVSSIGISSDEYLYNMVSISLSDEQIPYISTYHDYTDFWLSGNYLSIIDLSIGLLNWIPESERIFEETAKKAIAAAIPELSSYQYTMTLLDLAKKRYLQWYLSADGSIIDYIDLRLYMYNSDIEYITKERSFYDIQHEIFLKYNGTDIGYDPFYNYKNTSYSSYQVHPYLYSFIEKSGITNALANNFFQAFTEGYETELYKNGIDNIIGRYGNIINLHENGMYDFTSYQSDYEVNSHAIDGNLNAVNDNIGFTGLFYPPALEAFLSNTEKFIADVLDDNSESFYHHLNLSENQCNAIAEQLREYQQPIREIAQRWSSDMGVTKTPSLENEYDIYKFCEDINGNSWLLLKKYDYSSGQPSYNDKKNTPGEVWMRLKNHPIAFPAFDLRPGYSSISQINISADSQQGGADINEYMADVNNLFMASQELSAITRDTVGMITTNVHSQNLRCFFDMELNPTLTTLALAVPAYTGRNYDKYFWRFDKRETFNYANSSVLIGLLSKEVNINNQTVIYNFTRDTDGLTYSENNIASPGMVYIRDDGAGNTIYASTCTNALYKYDFIGFVTHSLALYALFVKKYLSDSTFPSNSGKPELVVQYSYYIKGQKIKTESASSSGLLYNIFSNKVESDWSSDRNRYPQDEYKYANVLAPACTDSGLTIGFVSQRNYDVTTYADNRTVVNFCEYTAMCEKKTDLSTYGENINYPADSSIIQTKDAKRYNIYNSFDTFAQHLINVNFKFNLYKIAQNNIRYFNLNADIGYNPQFADLNGKTRYYNNPQFANSGQLNIELLGPEKTDLPYTPIIISPTAEDEPYGRVTEDYEQYNKLCSYVEDNITIAANAVSAGYRISLVDIFGADKYSRIRESGELLQYKYTLFNTNYMSMPVLKGYLSGLHEYKNTYQGSEEYDLISGQEIIGPNNVTYQNINMSNHINNICAITTTLGFDDEYMPNQINLSCFVRKAQTDRKVISANTFYLLVYNDTTINTYNHYHLFENRDSRTSRSSQFITQDDGYEMDFKDIPYLSIGDYEFKGKKPFNNYQGGDLPVAMSAQLEFKYSEDERIDREFPYIDLSVHDDVIVITNDNQYTYFIAPDDYNSLSVTPFYMERYSNGKYIQQFVNTQLKKYQRFYSDSLVVETTYNLEEVYGKEKYGVVLYFNYKNFTNPQYVHYERGTGNNPPTSRICQSTDEEIKNTYLVLKPGENGRLDLRIDYVFYDIIDKSSINLQVVGKESRVIKTYYILNVSDSKPKFVISKTPFQQDTTIDDDQQNYELYNDYKKGTKFRFLRITVNATRGGNYLMIGYIKFTNANNESFEIPTCTKYTLTGNSFRSLLGRGPENIFNSDTSLYFQGFTGNDVKTQFACPVQIEIDLGSQIFDVETYTKWTWYNSSINYQHPGWMVKQFQLEASNDRFQWHMLDSVNDAKMSFDTSNNKQMYSGTLTVS